MSEIVIRIKKRTPKPREEIFNLYWYFASERHKIFENRLLGYPQPWTSDRTLQTYKFCNTYRASDRISQYLIKNVAYHEEPCKPEDKLFQIVAFRTFSNKETWETVRLHLGRYPTLTDLKNGKFEEALNYAKLQNKKLYTGAFILCANNAYGRKVKHLNHVSLFEHMFITNKLSNQLLKSRSSKEIFDLLHEYPLMGDFMSYQTAIDLNYSDLINFSENDFTMPGPGAMRGIRKTFVDLGDYSPTDIIMDMVDRQTEEFSKRKFSFTPLGGRLLHAIDCQGLFCELDKYCRDAIPSLKSNRKRIKTKFNASKEPLRLYYPPKWKIRNILNQNDAADQSEIPVADQLCLSV